MAQIGEIQGCNVDRFMRTITHTIGNISCYHADSYTLIVVILRCINPFILLTYALYKSVLRSTHIEASKGQISWDTLDLVCIEEYYYGLDEI